MTIEDVPSGLVWDRLRDDPDAMLVDVRTDAEWNFVGLPDLSELGRQPVLIPWQLYPSMQVNG
ncbi:rhodanese-like domain-containing protein, partial [Roseomonas sp. DSM 102946]|nr:rhodanese-like domain-containing protein [Roseomonas sp. DSM 102946]